MIRELPPKRLWFEMIAIAIETAISMANRTTTNEHNGLFIATAVVMLLLLLFVLLCIDARNIATKCAI